jgi:hypothetical protein
MLSKERGLLEGGNVKRSMLCALVVTLLSTEMAHGTGADHVVFDFGGRDTQEGWRLNIYGTDPQGFERGGSGKMEFVSGKYAGEKALRFSSREAGSYNFISPAIPDGNWRERQYFGAEIRYRGDGSAGRMQVYAVTPDGQYAISLRFDGTRTWKSEIHRSGWSRRSTPPLDWSKITRIYVHGSGTQFVDIDKITLIGGVKRIHLEENRSSVRLGDPRVGLRSDARIVVSQTGLFKLDKSTDDFNCRLLLGHKKAEGDRILAELKLTPPGEPAREVAKREITLGSSPETDACLPFEYEQNQDGSHLLDLVIRDAEGRVAAVKQFEFVLIRPRELDYQKVILWPEPQIWKPGNDRWILPETLTMGTSGNGDTFPAEHLAEKLASRYGIRVSSRQENSTDVRLDYVMDGIKPEGFLLDVDTSGVLLQASSSRGMYYAVRALLDIARQSSFAKPEAGILHAHCEDWPDIPMRVYTEFFISERYHKTPLSVTSFKKHIYDQIAGGRYNLYAMQISEHVQYDSNPELAPRNSFTKAELKEIIDFAREHYVDVAPGWNTPGHCGWLVGAHPGLQEDGDRKTLCTSNPEGMRILKDIAQELVDLFEPTYFHMGGDEVTHGWRRITERTCELCAGRPRNQPLLEHWSELAQFFEERDVTPILFDDMLSVRWNGGAPYHCAEILPKLPRNLIIATWGTTPLSVPTERLRELGYTPWWISTAFGGVKMDEFPAMWKMYDACGISETTTWVWSNFTHADYNRQCNYSTPSLHANATCCWKPAVATVGQAALIHSDGVHWSNVMQVPDWGTRKLSYRPVLITAACNDSTRDAGAGDGTGWMDLGPEHDLSCLPNGTMSIGGIPFNRPKTERDCILLQQEDASRPVKVGRRVLGFAFAHAAGAHEAQIGALYQRFFRTNTDPLAMPVAYYKVRYEDGVCSTIPVRLGYDVHLWDCDSRARVMPGPSTYWMGTTAARQRLDPADPDACVWVMEWKNPRPDVAVEAVTFVAAGTEATVGCLGMTAVE